MPVWTEALVHNDHHFLLAGNFYSVPTRHIGSTVQIRMGLKTVQAYSEQVLLRTPQNFISAIDKVNIFSKIQLFGCKDEITHRVC